MKNQHLQLVVALFIVFISIKTYANFSGIRNDDIISDYLPEETKDLEDWMIDEGFWKILPVKSSEFSINDLTLPDDTREIEAWMLNSEFWKVQSNEEDYFELESWMFDSDFWKI